MKSKQQILKTQFNAKDYERIGLLEDEIKELKQAFDLFDEDGSGKINPSELRVVFENLEFKGNKKIINNILSELENDYSRGMEFEEFLKISTSKISDKDSKKEVQKVFNMFDLKKNNRVSVNELKQISVDLGEEMTDDELLKMFKKADLDDDGYVTIDDFYNIITGKVYWDN
ncbi:hypothetical protein IMG5_118850 [Ichthyophthirius multifiliis]|uniref:EF-hand domain-containing protein n=1 Tax=Ichthyophthirius multifiliis TaxID=5932 RepID=G0QUR4_ICHMU|nr:hypothetical protein IMG5_118850 [Ichthyophthirius multifiliis]EGR31049.1 hypothetical protein IMG5_118850 [Ichthyophthirius multifiliis]|eukprot:XP_004034535.1 hypothetical protein IMG5_118850 [Ichthyophthirius multifiliis]